MAKVAEVNSPNSTEVIVAVIATTAFARSSAWSLPLAASSTDWAEYAFAGKWLDLPSHALLIAGLIAANAVFVATEFAFRQNPRVAAEGDAGEGEEGLAAGDWLCGSRSTWTVTFPPRSLVLR